MSVYEVSTTATPHSGLAERHDPANNRKAKPSRQPQPAFAQPKTAPWRPRLMKITASIRDKSDRCRSRAHYSGLGMLGKARKSASATAEPLELRGRTPTPPAPPAEIRFIGHTAWRKRCDRAFASWSLF
jgi:hypothetical protein